MSEDSAGEKLCFLKFFLLIGIYFDHRFSQALHPSNAPICFRSFFEGGLLLCKHFVFCFWLLLTIFLEYNHLQYIFRNFSTLFC